MESEIIKVSAKDILQIKKDIQFIKNQLMEETELTDWAKKELEEARKTPKEEYISMEEIEKEFLQDDL